MIDHKISQDKMPASHSMLPGIKNFGRNHPSFWVIEEEQKKKKITKNIFLRISKDFTEENGLCSMTKSSD